MAGKLVFVRHGQSTWNLENLFTGWVDVDLTDQGRQEARAAGQLLKAEGFEFLRRWIAESAPALPYNEAAKARIGKAIGDAVLPSRVRHPVRYLSTGKRAWPP